MKLSINRFSLKGALAVLLLSSAVLTGCKNEGCTDITANNYDEDARKDDGSCTYDAVAVPFTLHYHHMFNGNVFALGQEYTNAAGRKFNLSTAKFYVSGVEMEEEGMTTPRTFANKYLLVSGDNMQYSMGEVMPGHFEGLSFNVGIDSAANHSDPSTYEAGHPLAPQNPNMHWAWSSGYIFIRIEGMVDTTNAANGPASFPFEFHIGMDNMLRNVNLAKHFHIEEGSTSNELMIMVDWSRFFDNLDWQTENSSHTMDNMPAAMKIANNVANVFSTM